MKRISIAILIFCAGFASAAWAQQRAGECSNNWSEFHNTNMQRWNRCEKVLNVNNARHLVLKWKSEGGGSQAAIVNGVAFVSGGNTLSALDAKSGALLWNYNDGDDFSSSPAVANGVVYVGSPDHNVYALDAKTGTKLWSFLTDNEVVSSPAVVNGVVYIGSNDGYTGSLYALDAKSGAELWSDPFAVASSPAVVDDVVYVSGTEGNLYALDAKTGNQLWSYPAGGWSSPAVANGVVYATAGQSVDALNAVREPCCGVLRPTTMGDPRLLWRMAWSMWAQTSAPFTRWMLPRVLNCGVPISCTTGTRQPWPMEWSTSPLTNGCTH